MSSEKKTPPMRFVFPKFSLASNHQDKMDIEYSKVFKKPPESRLGFMGRTVTLTYFFNGDQPT